MRTICLVAAGALALSGCTSVLKNNIVTGKLAGGGVNISEAPSPAVQAGYLQSAITNTPALDSKGVPISYTVQCGVQTGITIYAPQNGNASASASTTSGPASAVAINELTATGDAARLAALGGGQAPSPAAITALNTCPDK